MRRQRAMSEEIKKAICFFCKPRCTVNVHVRDGRLIRVEPSRYRGCRTAAAREWFYHPDRLNFPLKRAGERGEGKWQQISWDQALDEVAARLSELREKYGAEAVAESAGTSRTFEELRTRFMHLFGSPNMTAIDPICHGNSAVVAMITYGWFPYWMSTEKLEATKCILIIGRNPSPSHQTVWEGMVKAKKKGAKIIAIDPRYTETTEIADLWLQLRPGTDCALLLSMINVIIEEGLYDRDFVTNWCHGFDKLAQRVEDYPPEKVADITWIPAGKIREAARMFALNRPSCAMEGMGVAQQAYSRHVLQAKYIISAIVGNIDVEGGEELLGPAPFITEHEIELVDKLPPQQRKKSLGGDRFKLFNWPGYELIQQSVERVWGKRGDLFHFTAITPPPVAVRAMAYGEPYPLRALITVANNPMVTWANTKLVYKALRNLELYVVVDFFMTPSAELADYVFPAASWLERAFLWNCHNTTPVITAGEQALPNTIPGEYDHRSDYHFWRGLGLRLGQEADWPWETLEEYYDYRLKPLGFTFNELVQMGKYEPPRRFKKYEQTGFGTPTGRVELYSTILEKLGYDPLPSYREPPESPVSQKELAQDYPLILTTGARFLPFFHSEHRQVESLRRRHPYPIVEIHPETAKRLDINDGDWVWIETPRGRIMQKCRYFDGIDPRVVHAQHGWWYPELPAEEPWLHGVWISNVNVLTEDELDHMDEAVGSWSFKNFLCKVRKVKKYEERASIPG